MLVLYNVRSFRVRKVQVRVLGTAFHPGYLFVVVYRFGFLFWTLTSRVAFTYFYYSFDQTRRMNRNDGTLNHNVRDKRIIIFQPPYRNRYDYNNVINI